MDKTVIEFGDTEIDKHKFHQYKRLISKKYIAINKIIVSNKVSFGKKGFKYFISYKGAKQIRSLCISLLKMNAYKTDSDESKYTSFLIKDDELLEKHNEILEKS